VHTNCTTCHGEPPSGSTAPNRDNAHSEHDLLGYGSVTPSCNACHNSATHYNNSTEVSIPSNFDDESYGSPIFNGSSCSNTRCHGGQTTPSWSTGTLDVNTQCTSCHREGTSEYNSYNSGEHRKHISHNVDCIDCHSTSKLATGHFVNLETPTFELDPWDTIGGAGTEMPNGTWDPGSQTCSLSCHGEWHSNDSWTGGHHH
jgi:predicted CxxxxCH...CXXCH cytochrome family protein